MTQSPEAELERAIADLVRRTRGGAPRDPARTRALLTRLGVRSDVAVVHVVGTNGKGSVAARIDAGARAAGLRTVRFTSPHVERIHERFAVGGEDVTDMQLRALMDRVVTPTALAEAAFFELATVMAVELAASQSADLLLLEAGVGAAADATMAVDGVVLTVITNVGEDHLATIGPTLRDVATDKAAAIRPGVPVVAGADAPADAWLRAIARERRSPLTEVAPLGRARGGESVTEHGARLAAAALRHLVPGEVLDVAVRAAACDPSLPARREWFTLPQGKRVLLDGAHNPPAVRVLASELPKNAHVLLGVAARKDATSILACFEEQSNVVLTAAVAGESPFGNHPSFRADPWEALDHALARLEDGGILVVTGSFYLAGAVRPILRGRAGAALPSTT